VVDTEGVTLIVFWIAKRVPGRDRYAVTDLTIVVKG
jgi:hypothetical protein